MDIRYWGSLDLNISRRSGYIRVFGDFESFSKVFARFIAELGLTKTRDQLLRERAGNFGSALSSAVVYIEDRLRSKLGTYGVGLTGTELVQAAYKTPGVLSPPLSHANNPEDNAHLMMRGWMGLVRNLHGHLGQRAYVAGGG